MNRPISQLFLPRVYTAPCIRVYASTWLAVIHERRNSARRGGSAAGRRRERGGRISSEMCAAVRRLARLLTGAAAQWLVATGVISRMLGRRRQNGRRWVGRRQGVDRTSISDGETSVAHRHVFGKAIWRTSAKQRQKVVRACTDHFTVAFGT